MCSDALVIYALCTCMRCHFSNVLDPEHSGYYPHYGSPIVAGDYNAGYTYILVSPEDRCESAEIDHNGYWARCDDPPYVLATRTIFAGSVDRHFCDECERVCFGQRQDVDLQGLDLLEVSDDEGDGEPEPEPEPESASSLDRGAGDEHERQRERSALRQRIYRGVLALLGYPEGTRLPFDERVIAHPAL